MRVLKETEGTGDLASHCRQTQQYMLEYECTKLLSSSGEVHVGTLKMVSQTALCGCYFDTTDLQQVS